MDVYCGSKRRRIRKSTGVKDKTQARMIEQSAIAVNRGISTRQRAMQIIDAVLPIDDQALKLEDARAFYEQCLKSEGISIGETTKEHRLNIIGIFAEWAKDHTRCETVEQVDSHIVFAFAQELNKRTCGVGDKTRPISVNTKNAYIGDLITAWKMFVKRSKATSNPWTVARFQRKREEEKHGRAFTPEEIERLLNVARQVGFDWETMIYVGMYTGLRQGDCANLKWSEVDFDRGVIELEPTKTKRFRTKVTIPIHRELVRILRCIHDRIGCASGDTQVYPDDWRRKSASFVMPWRCGSLKNRKYPDGDCSFNEIISRAKIEGGENDKMSFHCLRTTFVTRLAEAGVPQDVRMKLAGHASAQVHEIYDQQKSTLVTAIERLN